MSTEWSMHYNLLPFKGCYNHVIVIARVDYYWIMWMICASSRGFNWFPFSLVGIYVLKSQWFILNIDNWHKEIWINAVMGWSWNFSLCTICFEVVPLVFGRVWNSEGLWEWEPEILTSHNTYYNHWKLRQKIFQRKHKCEKPHIYLINVRCFQVMRNGIWWMKCHGQALLINNKMQHYSYHDYICLKAFFYCEARFYEVLFFSFRISSLIRLLNCYIYSFFFF